jgi:outer membrane lipoprotein carrier protein
MKKAATLWLGLCLVFGAQADSLDSLAQFLKQTRSMRADFVQVVAPPAKEGRPSKPKTSSGSFAFVRPSVFRFDYNKPFVQNIVADGKNLWL